MTIKFEDWEAERMKDPEFRAACEELEPAYEAEVTLLRATEAARLEYSKNERAGQLLGFRESGTAVLEPSELGYRCPVCKNAPMVEHEYDERLTWSEYNAFLWCEVCNRDFPSCLCVEDIWRAIDLFLASLDAAVQHGYKKRRNNMGQKTLIEMPKLFPTMKLWQHEETGRIIASESQPWKGWFEIPAMYEDELPKDISETVYSWWFENSFVDGVRIGPKITLGLAAEIEEPKDPITACPVRLCASGLLWNEAVGDFGCKCPVCGGWGFVHDKEAAEQAAKDSAK